MEIGVFGWSLTWSKSVHFGLIRHNDWKSKEQHDYSKEVFKSYCEWAKSTRDFNIQRKWKDRIVLSHALHLYLKRPTIHPFHRNKRFKVFARKEGNKRWRLQAQLFKPVTTIMLKLAIYGGVRILSVALRLIVFLGHLEGPTALPPTVVLRQRRAQVAVVRPTKIKVGVFSLFCVQLCN